MELTIIAVSILILTFLFGFFCGKLDERIKWNELIKEGKIPKPNKKLKKQ